MVKKTKEAGMEQHACIDLSFKARWILLGSNRSAIVWLEYHGPMGGLDLYPRLWYRLLRYEPR